MDIAEDHAIEALRLQVGERTAKGALEAFPSGRDLAERDAGRGGLRRDHLGARRVEPDTPGWCVVEIEQQPHIETALAPSPDRERAILPTGPHRRIARHARTLSAMRIVSLVPAATEIACALGATGELVAVTHDDDFPPEVLSLPRVTRSTIPPHATAREIDTLVREAGGRGESTFHLDEAALRDARPELILGQTLCAVCAVTLERVPTFARPPGVVALDASSLEGCSAMCDASATRWVGRARLTSSSPHS